MTDRNSMNRRGPSDLGDGAKWLNVSGETIPAYGVVQFKANFTGGYNQASKPDGASGLYFANGGVGVPSAKHGESLVWKGARLVLLDGSPGVGTVVGPTDGSWAMSEDGTGFVVMHQAVGGIGSVTQVGGGGGIPIIRFQIHEANCDARSAVVRILSRNGSVPGEYEIPYEFELNEAGDTVASKFVVVYDKVNCFLNIPDLLLKNRRGYATYLNGRPWFDYDPWLAFEVTGLCEQQTECEIPSEDTA